MAWVYRDTAVGQSCFANAVLPRCFRAIASSISGEAMDRVWDEENGGKGRGRERSLRGRRARMCEIRSLNLISFDVRLLVKKGSKEVKV